MEKNIQPKGRGALRTAFAAIGVVVSSSALFFTVFVFFSPATKCILGDVQIHRGYTLQPGKSENSGGGNTQDSGDNSKDTYDYVAIQAEQSFISPYGNLWIYYKGDGKFHWYVKSPLRSFFAEDGMFRIVRSEKPDPADFDSSSENGEVLSERDGISIKNGDEFFARFCNTSAYVQFYRVGKAHDNGVDRVWMLISNQRKG